MIVFTDLWFNSIYIFMFVLYESSVFVGGSGEYYVCVCSGVAVSAEVVWHDSDSP